MTLHAKVARHNLFSTSLHRLSSASSVLFGHPTACNPFAFLSCLGLYGIPCTYTIHGDCRLSPVDVIPLCSMTSSSTPPQCWHSHQCDCPHVAFHNTNCVGPRISAISVLNHPALLPNFLRLTVTITSNRPRFATDGMVSALSDRVSTC